MAINHRHTLFSSCKTILGLRERFIRPILLARRRGCDRVLRHGSGRVGYEDVFELEKMHAWT